MSTLSNNNVNSNVDASNPSPSSSSPPPAPRCSQYLEDLLNEQKVTGTSITVKTPCDLCNYAIGFHSRKPNDSVISSFSLPSSYSKSASSSSSSAVKNLPKWKTDYKHVKPFLQRFEQILTAENVDETQWSRYLLYSVENVSEAEWIKTNLIGIKDWERVRREFTKHFGYHSHELKLQQDYESCKQHKQETVQKYADRFNALKDDLQYEDTNKMVIQHFIMGLLPAIQMDFRKQLNTVKVLNKGQELELDSLKTVMELTMDLNALDLNAENSSKSNHNEDHEHNNTKGSSTTPKKDDSKKHCKHHPDSSTHTTAECRYGSNRSSGGSSNDSKTPLKSESQQNKQVLTKKGEPVVCHSCKGNHYANDPNCPSKTGMQTRSQTGSLPAKPTTSSTPAPSIQNRSTDVSTPTESKTDNPMISTLLPTTIPERSVLPEKLNVMFYLQNKVYNTLIDTGATISFMDQKLAEDLKLSIAPASANGTIRMAHSEMTTPRVGSAELRLQTLFPASNRDAIPIHHSFELLSIYGTMKDYHFVIGVDLIPFVFPQGIPLAYLSSSCYSNGHATIQLSQVQQPLSDSSSELLTDVSAEDFKGLVSIDEQPSRVAVSTPENLEVSFSARRNALLAELQPMFEENAKITGFCNLPESVVRLEIDPSKKHTLFRKQYPIPQRLFAAADAVIMRWFETGKICLAPPGCEYNNALTIAPKKDADGNYTGIRVCADTRPLNAALVVGDKFLIPHIREALEALGGNSIFGEFDLSEAYLQFRLHPDSQPLTAFTWNRKQYMFVGCPYGLTLLTSYFQRVMSMVFKDLHFVIPYVDNIPFASNDWETHKEQAILIISRLNEVNLKLKPQYNIGHAEMKCLGHVISAAGISPDSEKLKVIHDWPLPATGTDLQSFLGLCCFLRQHVRHYAELTGPLESIKYSKTIEWNESLIEHFNATKQALLTAPILTFPDYLQSFHLATDASGTGVGGVLFQPKHADEFITATNIVAICSKKLADHQRRWPAYKKELFGVIYCLRKFHTYIWGRYDTVVHTDHKPLTYMFQSTLLSPSLQQWLDVILDYRFEIRHRDGILNVIPDLLSRMFTSAYSQAPSWGVRNTPSFPGSAPIEIPELVSSADSTDVSIVSAYGSSIDDHPEDNIDLVGENEAHAPEIKEDEQLLDSLQIELLKRDKQCPDSNEEKLALIQNSHFLGHFGQQAVFKALWNKGFWWPSIRKDIATELKNCDSCNRYVVIRHGFHPAQFITASGPLEHLQIDTSVHLPESPDGFTTLLVCIDVFTGFIMLRPQKSNTAEETAKNLWEIFCIIGFPKILQSDNGSEFANDTLRTLVKISGIEHRLISPYNPRADGKVERSIQSIMSIVKKLLHGTNIHWPLFIPFAQISFNNKVSALTGASPFSLMFGRTLNELKDYSNDPTSTSTGKTISLDDWKEYQDKISSLIFPAISERIASGKDKMTKYMNKTRRLLLPTSIPAGSTVMIIDPHRENKFEPKYIGPYSVVRRAKNEDYVLKDMTGDILDRHIPGDQIKLIARKKRSAADAEHYEIEKVIQHRGNPGAYEYLVKWKNYESDSNSWEPQSSFHDTECIQIYWREKKKENSSQ